MSLEETAARIHRVTLSMVQGNPGSRVNFHGPAGVWDNADGLVGVSVEVRKSHAQIPCVAIASFVLTHREQQSDQSVKEKAEIAFAAIRHSVTVRIRPAKDYDGSV